MPDPDQTTNNEAAQGISPGNGDGSAAATPPAPDPKVAALEEKYSKLEEFARAAVGRAERSESTMQQMTASLQAAAQRQPQSNEPPVDIRERMADDPVSVLDAHFADRTGPIVRSVTENIAEMNKSNAMLRFGQQKIPGTEKTMMDVYGSELEKFAEGMPLESRANPKFYDSALQWIRSNNVDKEVELRMAGEREKEQRHFAEGSASAGTNAPVKKSLGDVEKQVAKGLGLSDEDYIKFRDMEA
jgi:hypothetical protein